MGKKKKSFATPPHLIRHEIETSEKNGILNFAIDLSSFNVCKDVHCAKISRSAATSAPPATHTPGLLAYMRGPEIRVTMNGRLGETKTTQHKCCSGL